MCPVKGQLPMESLSPGDSGPPDSICLGEIPKANGPAQTSAVRSRGAGLSSQVPGPQPRLCPQRPGWSEAPGRRSMSRHADRVGLLGVNSLNSEPREQSIQGKQRTPCRGFPRIPRHGKTRLSRVIPGNILVHFCHQCQYLLRIHSKSN